MNAKLGRALASAGGIGLLCLSGCGSTEFRAKAVPQATRTQPVEAPSEVAPGEGDAAKRTAQDDNQQKADGKTPMTVPQVEPLPVPAVPPVPTALPGNETPLVDICKPRTKPVRVLLVDLKSGWFAGDGGDLFKSLTTSACPAVIEIAYAHVTKTKIESNFDKVTNVAQVLPCLKGSSVLDDGPTDDCRFGDLSGFDAIGILSGSLHDPSDILTSEELFRSLLTRAKTLKSENTELGFFFGAGLGNSDHADAFASEILPTLVKNGKIFNAGAKLVQGILPSPEFKTQYAALPLTPGQTGTSGTFDLTGIPLKGITSIFDYKKESHLQKGSAEELGQCFTDAILSEALGVFAHDHCGNRALAFGKIEGHKIYLEGNMARFYGSGISDYFNAVINSVLP